MVVLREKLGAAASGDDVRAWLGWCDWGGGDRGGGRQGGGSPIKVPRELHCVRGNAPPCLQMRKVE